MESTALMIIYIFSGILWLVSAGFMLVCLREPGIRRPVLYLGGAMLVQSLGIVLILVTQLTDTDLSAIFPGFFFLGSAILFCVAIYYARQSYVWAIHNRDLVLAKVDLYTSATQFMPEIFALKDHEGRYLACNSQYVEFLGSRENNLVGFTDDQILTAEKVAMVQEIEKKAIETRSATHTEEEHGDVRGSIYSITRTPIFNQTGNLVGMILVGRSLKELRQVQGSLERWESNTQILAEIQNTLVAFPGQITDFNNLFQKTLQWGCQIGASQHVGIWKVDLQTNSAAIIKGNGALKDLIGTRIKPGEDIAGKVILRSESIIVPEYRSWGERSQIFRDCHFTAAIGQPLWIKNRVAYILTVYLDRQAQRISNEMSKGIEILAYMISSRLNSMERYEELSTELSDSQKKITGMQYRTRLEHLIGMIATYFIGLSPDNVDEGVVHSLQSISKFSGIDRCYLMLFAREGHPGLTETTRYGNWLNPSQPVGEKVSEDESHWYQDKFNQAEMVHVSDNLATTDESVDWNSWLRSKGLKSFTAIPMVSNRTLIGYLGLETVRTDLEFTTEMAALYKLAAEMFVNILEKKWTARQYKENQEKAFLQIRQLEQQNSENEIITEMGDLLQACRTADEAYPIITRYVQRLIPQGKGSLYMIHDPKDPAERVAYWGEKVPNPAENELISNECWSLRRGRMYVVHDPLVEPICGHIKDPIQKGYICVPLNAHGTAAGVLHLRMQENRAGSQDVTDTKQRLAMKIAEYIAMPLTNLKLRDRLRSQAIRDPLTGLFNRRYMEETLEREIRRAVRHSTSVGIIMFDIDRMKPINDRFGHDAGDVLLRGLGRELIGMFRGEDVACRYGGDEFTIVLPEATLAEVWRRAEQMRDSIKRLDLNYNGNPLGKISLSIGVAAFPDHGQTAERVLLACDAASYASKSEGGDRIMMGHRLDA